jgi:hypothetical protein
MISNSTHRMRPVGLEVSRWLPNDVKASTKVFTRLAYGDEKDRPEGVSRNEDGTLSYTLDCGAGLVPCLAQPGDWLVREPAGRDTWRLRFWPAAVFQALVLDVFRGRPEYEDLAQAHIDAQ